jgi:BASS family bile acid:Na+ symporter
MEFAAVALPVALGIIMFGLGLDLTPADFMRIARQPRAASVALACQLLLLPALCFGLVLVFRLPPVLAVGMMLLAASPGGAAANLYSHLFRGDVALNISLTAINSVIAVVSLPLITNLAVTWFKPGDLTVGLQFGKTMEVFIIVLVPVILGMTVRALRPEFARVMDRPVRITSIMILALVVGGAALSSHELLVANIARLGGIAIVFCVLSLALGYLLPLALRVATPQALASGFEVGIHNATLAIVIAQGVLNRPEMALPAAVYGALMFPVAAGFGLLVTRRPS